MNLLFVFCMFTGTVSSNESEIKLSSNTIEYFDDKGFNYKKHKRKQNRKKLKNKLFNANNCRGISHHA
jgi:hypothetical protein